MNLNRNRIRTSLLALTVGLGAATGLAGGVVAAPAAHASVTISGVTSYSNLTFDKCRSQVVSQPFSSENVNGRYSTAFRFAVYDFATSQWTWSGWQWETGVDTAAVQARSPWVYGYEQYARYINGGWQFNGEWVVVDGSGAGNLWC